MAEISDLISALQKSGLDAECPECGEISALQKMISNFTTKTEYYNDKEQVGDVVKDSIGRFKQELKKEKKQLSNRDYKE